MMGIEANKLAEKIARILESESQNPDLAALFAGIEKVKHHLDKFERKSAIPQPEISNLKAQSQHFSQQRFSIAEAITDEIFAGINKEKACTFEPNAKPCDHCAMCSSRGF